MGIAAYGTICEIRIKHFDVALEKKKGSDFVGTSF
jgi:hypothetical protein